MVVHTIHVLLAGAWLGGVLFTTFVVSPALKAMKWGEAQRVGVRAAIGRRYARVGSANLAFLALLGLVAAHGAVFGRRLAGLAEAELGAESAGEAASFARRRRGLQELSVKVSWLTLVVSVAVMVLAVNA